MWVLGLDWHHERGEISANNLPLNSNHSFLLLLIPLHVLPNLPSLDWLLARGTISYWLSICSVCRRSLIHSLASPVKGIRCERFLTGKALPVRVNTGLSEQSVWPDKRQLPLSQYDPLVNPQQSITHYSFGLSVLPAKWEQQWHCEGKWDTGSKTLESFLGFLKHFRRGGEPVTLYMVHG